MASDQDPDGDGENLLKALARWATDLRVDEAAGERERTRRLQDQAAEQAQLSGVLVDLGERMTFVAVKTLAGRWHRGNIAVVATDFVVVRNGSLDVFVHLDGLAMVRTNPEVKAPPATGDRPPSLNMRLRHVLHGIAPSRPAVQLGLANAPELVRGTLQSAGEDLLTMKLEGEGNLAYLPQAALIEMVVMDRFD